VSERAPEIRISEWLLAGALVAAFLPALIALVGVWTSVDYYSHGFLVPLVAYWAAARSRVRFAVLESRDRRAVVAVIAAVLLYALGLASGSVSLQGLALVVAVASCAFYLGGSRGLRVLAFPLAFLVFMVPLPEGWLTPLIVDLQLLVSSTAVELLGWFGSAVARSGNVIELPAGLVGDGPALPGRADPSPERRRPRPPLRPCGPSAARRHNAHIRQNSARLGIVGFPVCP